MFCTARVAPEKAVFRPALPLHSLPGLYGADMTTARKAISKKTRFEVFKRDAFTCQYCGAHPPGALLHVDHIVAVAAGGANDMDNLITACQPCNLGKGARDLKVAPQSLEDKARDVAEREAQLAGYQEILQARRDRLEEEAWRVAEAIDPGCLQTGVPHNSMLSIRRFIERLGVHEALEAADIARARFRFGGAKAFRYFFGVCWNKVREGEPT